MEERYEPELERISALFYRVWESAILLAAVELDLFTMLHDGPLSASEIAGKASLDSKGVRIVLDALCPLELIEKRAGGYALTATSARYLDSRSASYAGPIFWGALSEGKWETWGRVAEAVRNGCPVAESPAEPADFFRKLVKAISFPAEHTATLLADHLGLGAEGRRGWSILDAACGSGRYGLKLLEIDLEAHLTLSDLAPVLELASEEAERRDLASRVTELPGDIFELPLPEAGYDLILLSHFLHSLPQEGCAELIARLAASQRAGGYLAVHEFVPDEGRCRRRFPLLFAMNMYITNGVGDAYTFSQIRNWLAESGYGEVRMLDTPWRSSFVIGRLL